MLQQFTSCSEFDAKYISALCTKLEQTIYCLSKNDKEVALSAPMAFIVIQKADTVAEVFDNYDDDMGREINTHINLNLYR